MRELLLPEEFDAHIKNGTCRLAFIGMSNAGKSYRSKVLRDQAGFLWYQVDDDIRKELGLDSVEALSTWMGYPYSPGYAEREKEYLALEDRFTKQVAAHAGQNLVFDTTGSVCHISEETLAILRENCLVVHFDVGEDSLPQLIEKFFANPKPVAWSGYFSVTPGETEDEALRRCYPLLLNARLNKYRALAHVNLPVSEIRDTDAEVTLALIRKALSV